MYKAFYASSELTSLPLFALGFFVVMFLCAVLWVVVKRPDAFDAMASLPLDEGRPASKEIR